MSSMSVEEHKFDLTLEAIKRRIPDAVEILGQAVVLHIGWERDNDACVIRLKDGSKLLVTTSHGGVYEMDPEDLEQYIKNYETASKQSSSLLEILRR